MFANMLTADQFRKLALAMEGATESAHMGHPDFRANGRIFATLHPGNESGMVKLTPDQQQEFLRESSDTFVPSSGAWGRQGCTNVKLATVAEEILGQALTLAWQNTLKQTSAKRKKKK
ncbi:MAG TPA: MmcQ/YjbR family DNA-binding protein [Pyrinomonadaceae bacterium]|nr:MmcQ/YjbR family DNA-binding protein [Pyrinomonadaceae bacterium]